MTRTSTALQLQRQRNALLRDGLWMLLGLAAIAAAVLDPAAASRQRVVLSGLCAVLALGALGAAVAAGRTGRAGLGITTASMVVLGVSAGALAVPAGLPDRGGLSVFLGAAVVALLLAVLIAADPGRALRGAHRLLLAVALAVVALTGAALLLDWPGSVVAAVLVGTSPLALHALPATSISVPDGQLLEYGVLMRARWTVRGVIPSKSHPLSAGDVDPLLEQARRRLDVGTVVFCVLPAVAFPVVLARAAGTLEQISALVLVAFAMLSLLLLPRTHSGVLRRTVPRVAAGVLALEYLAAAAPAQPAAVLGVVAGLLVIALVAALAVAPIRKGFRSLGLSRAADLLQGLSLAFVLPAALVAGGCIDVIRGVMA